MAGARSSCARRAAGHDPVVQRHRGRADPEGGVGPLRGRRRLAHHIGADRLCSRDVSERVPQPPRRRQRPASVRYRRFPWHRVERRLRLRGPGAGAGHSATIPDRGVPGRRLSSGPEAGGHLVSALSWLRHWPAGRRLDGGVSGSPSRSRAHRSSVGERRARLVGAGDG